MNLMISRYRFDKGLRFSSPFLGFMGFYVTGKDTRQDRAGYLMDSGTDSGRNGDGRRKEDRNQRNGQGIVLHADFQCNRMLLLFP